MSEDAQGSGGAGRVYRPVYRRWWFWIVVVLLAAGAWYAKISFDWEGEQAQRGIQGAVQDAYVKMQQKKAADLEAAYKADTYGGATPEETLRLFVEALEKKDYELASRYFVVEEQAQNLKKMPEGVKSGSFVSLIGAYKTGDVHFTQATDDHMAEADVIPNGQTVGFYFRFIPNPANGKWKITDR